MNPQNVMVEFISLVRKKDDWRYEIASRAAVVHEARGEANIGFLKDPIAHSSDAADLTSFLESTALDTAFLVQLPSISKSIKQWWEYILALQHTTVTTAVGAPCEEMKISPSHFREFFRDVAYGLVECKTTRMTHNCVSNIMRALPIIDSVAESIVLTYKEFANMVFILPHLMCETTRVGQYMGYLDETLQSVKASKASRSGRTAPGRIKVKTQPIRSESNDSGLSVIEQMVLSQEAVANEKKREAKALQDAQDAKNLVVIPGKPLIGTSSNNNNTTTTTTILSSDAQVQRSDFQNKWKAEKKNTPHSTHYAPPMHISSIKYTKYSGESSNKNTTTTVFRSNKYNGIKHKDLIMAQRPNLLKRLQKQRDD